MDEHVTSGLRLFYSYAQQDDEWRKKLDIHLTALQRQGIITSWHRQQVIAGAEPAREIERQLEEAHLILLLVSPDFIASEHCYGNELAQALQRHEQGYARVIPILVRSTDWQSTPFGHLRPLPTNGKPAKTWKDQEAALVDIVQGIKNVIDEWSPSHEQLTASPGIDLSSPLYQHARTRYLEHLFRLYSAVRLPVGPTEGFSLPAIFQPLRLRQNPLAAEDLEREQRPRQPGKFSRYLDEPTLHDLSARAAEPADITVNTSEEALEKSAQKRIVILGGPGTGKTTTLKHLVGTAARDALFNPSAPLPIFVSLADLARSGKTLQQYLHEQVEDLNIEHRFADLLWKAREAGHAFFCLDGLDEVAPQHRPKIIKHINLWATEKGNSWVIGSRFTEYKGGQFTQGQFREWELLPMNATLRLDLTLHLFSELQRLLPASETGEPSPTAFVAALEQHPQAAAWGKNPLLFSLAAIVYFQTGGLPPTRAMLYREVIEAVLTMREPNRLRQEQLLPVLSSLALWLHQKKGHIYTLDDLLEFLGVVQQHPWDETTQVTQQIIDSGMMELLAHDTYSFRHQTFQEYLAATELARRLTDPHVQKREEAWALAWSKRTYSRWTGVLRLMVGVLAQLPDKRGIQEAVRWIHALMNQQTTAEGDPGLLGFVLALKSLVELVGSSTGEHRLVAQLEGEIAERWVNELLSAAKQQQYLRRRRLEQLTEDFAYLSDETTEVVIQRLQQALGHTYSDVRRCAVEVLAELKPSGLPQTLLEIALYDKDSRMRSSAARALKKLEERAPVEPFLEALHDPQRGVRRAAAEALGELGERAPIEPLVEALHDPEADVRKAAAYALGELGERAPIEPLVEALNDPDWEVLKAALDALGELGERAPVEPLVEALHDPGIYVSAAAAYALGKVGERAPIEPLVEALHDSKSFLRQAAAEALGKVGERAPIEPLVEALHDSDALVRYEATFALEKVGERAPIEPLVEALHDPDTSVRRRAAYALGKVGEEISLLKRGALVDREGKVTQFLALQLLTQKKIPEAIEKILIYLQDTDAKMRTATVECFMDLGKQTPVEPLLALLSDPEWSVRSAVVKVFGALGEEAPIERLISMLLNKSYIIQNSAAYILWEVGKKIPAELLMEYVDDPDEFRRSVVVRAMGELGERAPVEPLIDALYDPEGDVRMEAAYALGELGERAPVEPLIEALHDPEGDVREAAARALGKLGERAPIEPLIEALHDHYLLVSEAAAEALGKLGERAPVEPLVEALHDPELLVRASAARTLGELGERAPVEPLVEALHDPELFVREAAVEALGKLGERAPVELLVEALHNPEGDVRKAAAYALGELGERAPVEPLVEALHDPEMLVSRVAAYALGELGERAPVEPLVEALHDPEEDVRRVAAYALGELGERAPVEPLIEALYDPERDMRRVVTEALSKLGARVPTASLIVALCDEDIDVRAAALKALKGREDDEMVREVFAEAEAILKGQPSGKYLGSLTQGWRAEIIGFLSKGEPDLLDSVTQLLDWPHWQVRIKAAEALGNIRRNIPDVALLRLLAMRQDSIKAVRDAADDALAQILSLEAGIEDDERSGTVD
ncbi:HEAT repeat domain-containing protein [Dictyobacter aurantiacus]|uniref:Uncharacterized protein n=1 Tax=Dictyobacter aurantiacus TaxID=1936993 RepID=A0A401ZJH5_9CHLR|nr:HEAT repeat domain-containing protein [Dictyobacter aurantiacus]GCE06990.1 hypothetical protein KDAU_43190 [Dictyobacter aurantiacus]